MGKDAGKIAGIAALGATGLGIAGYGPLAGMMAPAAGGASAAGGIGALGGGQGLLAAGSTLAPGAGLQVPAAMSAANSGALMSPAITGGATGLAKVGAANMFAGMNPLQMGMVGANMMNQEPQQPGMPTPPVMPMQGQPPQQPFTGMSPYQLPGGMKLHSMNTAGMFRRG